jgi:hypothetical protein
VVMKENKVQVAPLVPRALKEIREFQAFLD